MKRSMDRLLFKRVAMMLTLLLVLAGCGKDDNVIEDHNNNGTVIPIGTYPGGTIGTGVYGTVQTSARAAQIVAQNPCKNGQQRMSIILTTSGTYNAGVSETTLFGPFQVGAGQVGAANAVFVGQDHHTNDFIVVNKSSNGAQSLFTIEMSICEDPNSGITRNMQVLGFQPDYGITLRHDNRCGMGTAYLGQGFLVARTSVQNYNLYNNNYNYNNFGTSVYNPGLNNQEIWISTQFTDPNFAQTGCN